ncbi:MAG: hypothetical protein IPN76_21645 [Saprospiraceae bacterium]|nr:hypothetical protein [Saprospiraceae bacterium]
MTIDCNDFIKSLAYAVQNDIKNARLILAGFKDGLPIEIQPFVRKVELSSFGNDDLSTFFGCFYDMLPMLTEKCPTQAKGDFINESLLALESVVDINKRPNVETIGVQLKDYCDIVINKMIAA